MKKKNKKPDFETESIRAWIATKKERDKLSKESYPIIIEKDGNSLQLLGFAKFIDKKGKPVFAYKFNHEEKILMYHIPDDLSEEDRSRVGVAMLAIKMLNEAFNYQLLSSQEIARMIGHEANTLENLAKLKEKKKHAKKK